ncbi:uncharacterized protein TNCV_2064681 [Trichonephila clavipes]|nr:uncharacterized protein TNCV_2064681 [Trichonephila clavipes]
MFVGGYFGGKREKREIKKFEERRLAREFELERLRAQLRNKLNGNKLKAGNRINNLANVYLSRNRTTEVSESINKCRPLINPVVNKSVENATSCDFEKENCDPPVRWTNVFPPSEVRGRGTEKNNLFKIVEGKEFNVYRNSDCEVKVKAGLCEGRVEAVAMGAQRVINPDNIANGSFELKGDMGVANPKGLICENICEEKYTIGTLMDCEKQLTVDRESFRNQTMAKIAGMLKGGKKTCVKHIKLELANLVMDNNSKGIDSETLYSVKLFMDFRFQGNLRKSQLYFKLPPDRSSYLRMINAKKKERFLPDPGTIVLRQKDINLVTGKPFRIKTCCSSQMLINSLREDTEYLLDLGVNGMGQSNRTLPVVWLGRVNRYPYPRIKCIKYRNLNQERREKKEKRREREEPGLGWRKGKSPALDGEGMRGESWLERTGRER